LGTFITESTHGLALCSQIFSSEENIGKLVDHLTDLCEEHFFDGWLINIENSIDVSLHFFDENEGFSKSLWETSSPFCIS
jgi:hypothetical protein